VTVAAVGVARMDTVPQQRRAQPQPGTNTGPLLPCLAASQAGRQSAAAVASQAVAAAAWEAGRQAPEAGNNHHGHCD
jgi:hypothetical protein